MLRLMDTKNKKIKTKTMKTNIMKTMRTIYIFAAFLGLQFNPIFAAGNLSESPVMANEAAVGSANAMLMPATPHEATFEDLTETHLSGLAGFTLTPVVPMIADFNDEAPAMEISLINLAPVTPKEADFEDIAGFDFTSSIGDLAPATPQEASFEELEPA
jgi:hypothetical protein